MVRDDQPDGNGELGLSPVLLHTYDSGDYGSAEELVEDLDSEWDEYREEWDLDDYGTLEEEFEVQTHGGFLGDETVVVDSEDERYVFREDSGSLLERFTGSEDENWMAESYTTEHIGESSGPYKGQFLNLFVLDNFQTGENFMRGGGADN